MQKPSDKLVNRTGHRWWSGRLDVTVTILGRWPANLDADALDQLGWGRSAVTARDE